MAGVDARGRWPGLRRLVGISDVPIIRSDGSVHQTPGHDLRTGIVFDPPSKDFPRIPARIVRDDAIAARDALDEVVVNFPFETPAHKSAWLSGLLTSFARAAFDGPSPLFLTDANVRGSGKTLLIQAIGHIAFGHDIPVSSYSHDSIELRKSITTIAIAGDSAILFDNLSGPFGNDVLDRLLTSTRWKDRVLGLSKNVDLPLLTTFYATGNNVSVAADTSRRVIHIRLDCLEERPEHRVGFKHPNLIAWIDQNRPRLLSAAMAIVAGYLRCGKPNSTIKPFGSFEAWSNVIRQAVLWVDWPDPCLTQDKLVESSDTATDAIGELIEAWHTYHPPGAGVLVAAMLATLYPADTRDRSNSDAAIAMRAALESFVNCPPGKAPTARMVGNRLRAIRRRVVDNKYFDRVGAKEKDGLPWKLVTRSGN